MQAPAAYEVYLDNAATTRVDEAVAAAMVEAMTAGYGNPSSSHAKGADAARALEKAREQVAALLGGEARDVYFTSGGTEADALGVQGVAEQARGRHIVVSAIEHPAVLEAARRLGGRGFSVTEVPPSSGGVALPEALADAVRDDTAVVALMHVQNELGTVQPIEEAARAVKARNPRVHFHVDAVQSFGKLHLDVSEAPFDSVAVSAHKIHGPKGVGALWLRRGARVSSLTIGGGQERGVRPGTENLPGAVALGLCAELCGRGRSEALLAYAKLGAALVERARAVVPGLRIHGDPAHRAPHIVSLGLPSLPAEPLLHALSARGVYVSAGSACHARDRKPSAVLRAIGVPDDMGVLRFSFGRFTTLGDVERAGDALAEAVAELRA